MHKPDESKYGHAIGSPEALAITDRKKTVRRLFSVWEHFEQPEVRQLIQKWHNIYLKETSFFDENEIPWDAMYAIASQNVHDHTLMRQFTGYANLADAVEQQEESPAVEEKDNASYTSSDAVDTGFSEQEAVSLRRRDFRTAMYTALGQISRHGTHR